MGEGNGRPCAGAKPGAGGDQSQKASNFQLGRAVQRSAKLPQSMAAAADRGSGRGLPSIPALLNSSEANDRSRSFPESCRSLMSVCGRPFGCKKFFEELVRWFRCFRVSGLFDGRCVCLNAALERVALPVVGKLRRLHDAVFLRKMRRIPGWRRERDEKVHTDRRHPFNEDRGDEKHGGAGDWL
jgi:hypothetical protein